MDAQKNDKLAEMQKEMMMGEKRSALMVGRIASACTIMMYVSYIPEIIANMSGHPVNILQPTVAALNGALWCFYALNKRHRDWAVFIGNFPGIIFGIVTVITALLH